MISAWEQLKEQYTQQLQSERERDGIPDIVGQQLLGIKCPLLGKSLILHKGFISLSNVPIHINLTQ